MALLLQLILFAALTFLLKNVAILLGGFAASNPKFFGFEPYRRCCWASSYLSVCR